MVVSQTSIVIVSVDVSQTGGTVDGSQTGVSVVVVVSQTAISVVVVSQTCTVEVSHC